MAEATNAEMGRYRVTFEYFLEDVIDVAVMRLDRTLAIETMRSWPVSVRIPAFRDATALTATREAIYSSALVFG